ncbi:RHS repeat-associated core domain-containing protein [Pseudoxanthomonas wuyuanensis]|uniref:RHS repeat-associated core domain-containing protein n=2 Tax=Pseudoxanthomonas wuyuanensis TaxID=1073196 RepID=A0A286DBI1_9GAMM|nr:RHS repeat-associated core domain-containing protein [Pseudoxanthomonas wuyuanensis]
MATGLHSIMSMAVRAVVAALLWLLALSTSAQTVRYIHTDALGSVAVVTDQNRNVVERREYEPYGRQLTPAIKDGPGYTGHVQDAATGLTYMQQRYYDPGIGRFLSVDPITALSSPAGMFNRYKYAANNPYGFKDPDGRQECRSCEMSYGASVGYMLRNDPERMRIWSGGEAAATTAGSGAEDGAALGQAAGEFVDNRDFSATAVATMAIKAVVFKATHRRVTLRKDTRQQIEAKQPRNSEGQMVDPNTGQPLKPGEIDVGHKPGQEWRKRKADHEASGSSRSEVIRAENNPDIYQLEDRSSNRSRRFEDD